jgi:thioredoxin 1
MLCPGIFTWKKNKPDVNRNNIKRNEWPDYVVTLDESNFNTFIRKYPLSVIDFWAPWCAPCQVIAPRIRRLSKIYKGRVAFGKLNTQQNEELVKQYRILSIPHLIFFHYGKKITDVTGVESINKLKNELDRLLKNFEC